MKIYTSFCLFSLVFFYFNKYFKLFFLYFVYNIENNQTTILNYNYKMAQNNSYQVYHSKEKT